METKIHSLKKHWVQEAAQWGACDNKCLKVLNGLLESYGADNRHYHSLSHIEAMLDMAKQVQGNIQNTRAVYFAIWFHDAVQIQGQDSERLSANLARRELTELGAPSALIKEVNYLILATKNHSVSEEGDAALFLDIDLSILAAEPKQYKEYSINCRKEYSLPNFVYNIGRKKFLKSLIKKAFIFNSQLFQETKEHSARTNINWELKGFTN